MEYQEIIVSVESDHLEQATDIASLVAPQGVYVEDYRDLEEQVLAITHMDLIEPSLRSQDKSRGKIHLYLPPEQAPGEVLSFLEARLQQADIPFVWETRTVAEEDWANAWKQYYKPLRVGKRLVVKPSWESYAPLPGDVVLVLDPGMAFGTGTHETTQLCLGLLEDVVTAGCSVLDVGCGSGVLAVASLLLGAKSALGVDLDPAAVQVAKENAQRNGLADKAQFQKGDLTAAVEGAYDVVCANIVADVLLRLLPDAKRFLAPEGKLLLSGIITDRAGEMMEAIQCHGLMPLTMLEEKGWVAICCTLADP